LTDVNEEMLIYREETFGPVAAVIPFETEEDVLAVANDTRYALASYGYTRDMSRAMRIFEALRFAIASIRIYGSP
jgi:succinate-semialdehyde dehydrogenase/glutarate-semialdehyde dehydrogenase